MREGLMTEVTKDLQAFQKTMPATKKPIIIKVDVLPDAVTNDCFVNVEKKIAACGGSIVHGWRVYQVPRAYLEAEFHAVWKSPQGFMRDVSDCYGLGEVVFVPDLKRVFTGKCVVNIFFALSNRKEVTDYITAATAYNREKVAAQEGVQFRTCIWTADHPKMIAAHAVMIEAEHSLLGMLVASR